jgi:hypothetical protein
MAEREHEEMVREYQEMIREEEARAFDQLERAYRDATDGIHKIERERNTKR